MRLAIDASNISGGGGVTHLVQLLYAADPLVHGFDSIVVWAPRRTLAKLPHRRWIEKRHADVLESNYLRRAVWQTRRLGSLVRAEGCDVLLVPGGSFATNFRPVVNMSRNLLPFDRVELARYGWSLRGVHLRLLRVFQSKSLRAADGVIFLTSYGRERVLEVTGPLGGQTAIVPHGVTSGFFRPARRQRDVSTYSEASPMRLLYVSSVDLYKHQWHVVEAVASLRGEGIPISLTLVGPALSTPARRRLERTMRRRDPLGEFVSFTGPAPHETLPARYGAADLCVFASSCENMPNVLLEAMASGVPVACSSRSAMPELLGDAGVYFDPERPSSIADSLRTLIASPELRTEKARAAVERARAYSWARCARDTMSFLASVAAQHAAPSQSATPPVKTAVSR